MKRILFPLLMVGAVVIGIWSAMPQRETTTVHSPAVGEVPEQQQLAVPTLPDPDGNDITQEVPLHTVMISPEPVLADEISEHEIVHNPVVPVEKPTVKLTQNEVKLYTKKRDEASAVIQQAMLDYDNYLDDPIKRAEIRASLQNHREAYKQAILKLGKELINKK